MYEPTHGQQRQQALCQQDANKDTVPLSTEQDDATTVKHVH